MPVDATPGAVPTPRPASHSQAPSELQVAKEAKPPRTQTPPGEPSGSRSQFEGLEGHSRIDTPDGARTSAAASAGVGDVPWGAELFQGAMEFGGSKFLEIGTKIHARHTSPELRKAITSRERNPHLKAALVARDKLWQLEQQLAKANEAERPALETQVAAAKQDVETTSKRHRDFQARASDITETIQSKVDLFSAEIEKFNASGVIDKDAFSRCASDLAYSLFDFGYFDKAIEVTELGMAYGGAAFRNYHFIASVLVAAGKPQQARELIGRVQQPGQDFSREIGSSEDRTELGYLQVGMGQYREALRTIDGERDTRITQWIAAMAYQGLANHEPEGATRKAYLDRSTAALERFARASSPADVLVFKAQISFVAGDVQETLRYLGDVVQLSQAEVLSSGMETLLGDPYVMNSAWRGEILASPVWQDLARVTGRNFVDELMDIELVQVEFDLPPIPVRVPLHPILSVRDLETNTASATRPRTESDAERP
jgi:hypothetical protein